MFISGLLLLGSDYSYFPYVVPTEELTGLELGTGRYDSIYASRSTAMPLIDPPSLIWDTDTVFCADYEKSINAGNIDFSLSTISQLAVRRRKYGTFNWTTVCVRNIDSKEDLQFAGIDLFNAGNTDYEYALVPILNGAEGNYYIVSVHSDFEGIYIFDKNRMFGTTLDIKCSTSRKNSLICQTSLRNRYPRAIYNSSVNYDSGSVEAFFCRYDTARHAFHPDDSCSYRHELMDFLTDGRPKILKASDGRMWLINVDGGSVSDNEGDHWQHRMTSFNWFESGDCLNERDLYDADLIDIDSEYWSYGG